MSTSALGMRRPKVLAWRAWWSTSAACRRVLEGMQPRRMHRPPSSRAPSTMATVLPRSAATRAALKPAEPPPMTRKSKDFIRGGVSAAFAEEHHVDGFQDDGGIEHEREVPDVVEVVFEFSQRVLDARAVGIVDLGPAGDAGFDQVPKVVAGDLRLVVAHQFVPLGARADEAHVALEHVPELG